MKKLFVDSNYIVDYLRGKFYTKSLIEKIRSRQLEAFVSVTTLFELYTGALLSSNSTKKFEDISAILNWFNVVDIDKETMLIAAKIYVNLRKKGLMIEIQDILIAASCLSMNMTLLTNNKKHFQNIEGLRLE